MSLESGFIIQQGRMDQVVNLNYTFRGILLEREQKMGPAMHLVRMVALNILALEEDIHITTQLKMEIL